MLRQLHNNLVSATVLIRKMLLQKAIAENDNGPSDFETLQSEFNAMVDTGFGIEERNWEPFRIAFLKLDDGTNLVTNLGLKSRCELSWASYHEMAYSICVSHRYAVNWETAVQNDMPGLSSFELVTRLKQEFALVDQKLADKVISSQNQTTSKRRYSNEDKCGVAIHYLKSNQNATDKEVAKHVGVHPGTISRWVEYKKVAKIIRNTVHKVRSGHINDDGQVDGVVSNDFDN